MAPAVCAAAGGTGPAALARPRLGTFPEFQNSKETYMNGLHTAGGSDRHFPEGFLWGVGTSSYQIEGGVGEDGRGNSIWDAFTHVPGHIAGGDTGDIACDSYHRVGEDVALLAELGVGAYRFSIAWPRVIPTGVGAVNQRGLDYYRALVDELCAHEIMPVVTVYHWELPQALEDLGGWARRDTAAHLAEYAAVLAEALGDRVGMWITVNEPKQAIHQGYRLGSHAPGRREPEAAAAGNHHILLAHGLAITALRAALPSGTPVGIVLDPHPFRALTPDVRNVVEQLDAEHNRMYLDPVLRGTYPAAARVEMHPPESVIRDGDMEVISAPLDFLGINYYRPHHVRRGDWSDLRRGEEPLADQPGCVEYLAPGDRRTVMDWLVDPSGLREILTRVHAESGGVPIYITENGCAAEDYVTPEGVVDDTERVRYIHDHLRAALLAIEDGVKLAGYFHWSLMDNFEWAWGYRRRFGLYHVDFGTQRRLPKRSASYYAEVMRSGRIGELAATAPPRALTPVASA
jgi:beta-glucosidase